jgi:hypothetical protein
MGAPNATLDNSVAPSHNLQVGLGRADIFFQSRTFLFGACQKHSKMARHEAKAKRTARVRKDRVRSLAAEAATQEQVLATPPPPRPALATRERWSRLRALP